MHLDRREVIRTVLARVGQAVDATDDELAQTAKVVATELAALASGVKAPGATGCCPDPGSRHSEAMLRALLDSTDDLVWAVDSEQHALLAFNGATAEHVQRESGISLALGMRPADIFPGADLVRLWTGFYERALREESYSAEHLSPGGKTLELRFRPLREQDRVFGISVSCRDITRQREAELACRQSEARFRAVFEASPLGIGMSRDGTTVLANPAYARMMGYTSAQELVGTPIVERIAPGSRAEVAARYTNRIAKAPPASEFEAAGLRKNGTEFPFQAIVADLDLPDGRAAVTFFRDLTEQRTDKARGLATETQLRHAQQMEVIGTLAAGFAHDFNNTLAPILAFSQIALSDLPPDSATAEDLAGIFASAKRAQDLVRQILLLCRPQGEVQRGAVELAPLIKETARLLRATIPASIEIRQELGPEGVSVVGEQNVQVQVGIDPIQSNLTLSKIKVEAVGLLEGFLAAILPGEVDVILSGPAPLLDSLLLQDIRVVVDVSGLVPGTYQLAPRVDILVADIVVESILPNTVEVVISIAPTATPGP